MLQHDVVREVMQGQGGYATLGALYQAVVRHPEWRSDSRTPFASIRRIVQDERFFFRLRPGLWALLESRDALSSQIPLSEHAAPHQIAAFDHSYYQGLLVELGRLRGFATCVPHQDKNRQFLGRALGEIATLPTYPEFTYPEVMRRARTVDVAWFNERRYPHALYEVEHSTDMQNSLLKFVELQDFRSNLIIVADAARKPQFADELHRTAFRPLRDLVHFLDYESLANEHDRASQYFAQGLWKE